MLLGKVWADGQAEPAGWMFRQEGWAPRAGAPGLNGGSLRRRHRQLRRLRGDGGLVGRPGGPDGPDGLGRRAGPDHALVGRLPRGRLDADRA